MIYKLVTQSEWTAAEEKGVFTGSEVDLRYGYIHFSTGDQLAETATKHFAGQTDLLLIAVDPARVENDLKWEPSRNDELFPHLYAPLQLADVHSVEDWTG